MKLKQWAIASFLAISTLSSQAAVAVPGGSLGTLDQNAELFGSVGAGTSFNDVYNFSLDGLSTVTGSVAQFFGSVRFTSVNLGASASTLVPTDTGYRFSFADLSAGNYTLMVAGSMSGGFGAYTGSIMAQPVPEPETFAMLVAGLGVMGAVVARRRKPR